MINPIISLFLGFIYIILFSSFWAILIPISWSLNIILMIFAIIISFKFKNEIWDFYTALVKDFIGLEFILKFFFIIITLLILAKSSSPSTIIDNESYYIQTIKWLNKYGFVKGLVNLHPFLGQTSGWHILQSIFNFSYFYDRFNDINGLALIFINFFSLIKLNSYFSNNQKNWEDLLIGLVPISNLYFFQFINAPSPDLPVYLISFIILYIFITLYRNYDSNKHITLYFLSFGLIYIKITSVSLLLFPIILSINHIKLINKYFRYIFSFGLLFLIVFLIKNYIITGNLIYPFKLYEFLRVDWSLPKELEIFFWEVAKSTSFNTSYDIYLSSTKYELVKLWIFQPKLHGFLNSLMLLLLLISPVFIYKSKNRRVLFIIYSIAVINIVILFLTSPQYRFFYQFILILSYIVIIELIKNKTALFSFLIIGILLPIIPLFFLSNYSKLTNNELHIINSTFRIKYIIEPAKKSKYHLSSEKRKEGNLLYNSPKYIDFFWGTGNLEIPALNKVQLEYFKKYYKIIPQQRSSDLKNGFYSKVIETKGTIP